MTLDADICWRATTSRDRRFDGRFFIAVATTHIYCRPGCPARMPARRNVRFYSSAAAAETAGFRPCRRCRPDTSPGSAAWIGAPAVVARALRLIEGGALAAHPDRDGERGVEALAARLGIGGRRLRQLFSEHVGASPLEVARTHRAHLARRLLESTALPLEHVAQAAGYASARRLHAALAATFRCSPGELRRGRRRAAARPAALELRLPARAPFDPAPLLAFLGARTVPGLERVERGAYRRAFSLGDDLGVLEAQPDARGITLSLSSASARSLVPVAARIARMFDLDADTVAIAAQLRRDPALRACMPVAGVRVPGAWDPFEHAVRALLGQQVTVAGACTLAGRIVARCGVALPAGLAGDGLTHVFPTPARLATANLDGLGITGARVAAIRSLARAVDGGTLDLDAHGSLDDAVATLTALPGIGDWTAQYIALRALGEPDAFPAGDLGVRKALARDGRPASQREAVTRAEAWRPWRGYAVIALWTHSLAAPAATRTPRSTLPLAGRRPAERKSR
jgi:AraC family transcriptional regulator, regulatory protein of adaptative response / DNA-3-methyladenine glycosylase II